MTINISSTSVSRILPQNINTDVARNSQKSLKRLLENGANGGEVGALIAKKSIVNQAETSMRAQANTSKDVALALLG